MKKAILSGKRFVSLLLALTMALCTLPMDVIAEGETTEESETIEISTVEDLYNVRNNLAANYILMNDIDLAEATAAGGDYDYFGNGWNPIGSNDVYSNGAFTGTFDGNGYSIIGMRIDITSLPSGCSDLYCGLFANNAGVIKNLSIVDAEYNQTTVVTDKLLSIGMVAGASSGTITNCKTVNSREINVTVVYPSEAIVGGLVGKMTAGCIEYCANEYDIDLNCLNSISCGGICGKSTSGTIDKCYNEGNVLSNDDSANSTKTQLGGICSEGTVINSYNRGSVTAKYRFQNHDYIYETAEVYGISREKISNCYNVGSTKKINYNNNGSESLGYAIGSSNITTSFYLNGVGKSAEGATSLSAAQMKVQSMYNDFDFETIWTLNTNCIYPYPQLVGNQQENRIFKDSVLIEPEKTEYFKKENLDLKGCQIKFIYENSADEFIDVTEAMVTGFDPLTLGEQKLTVTYNGHSFTFDVVVKDKEYIFVSTVEELYNIRNDLDGNYILVNDIDLTDATAKGGDYDFNGNGWNPIGSNDVYSNAAFTGTFDGNGYSINGLRIDVTTLPSGTGDSVYVGLFSNVSGNIKNLTVRGNITFNYNGKILYLGAIAGYSSGVIENCKNEANINVTSKYTASSHNVYVGGLVGYLTNKINQSANRGNIEVLGGAGSSGQWSAPTLYCSGLAGFSNQGNIDNSYNIGNIVGSSSSGHSYNAQSGYYWKDYYVYHNIKTSGLCYSNSTAIINCYNAGHISSLSLGNYIYCNSAGINGGNATVTCCYNVGNVSGANTNYAIGTGTVSNCYYLANSGSTSTGATSLSSTQMKSVSMYKNFDFDAIWIEDENAVYEYPQLRNNLQDTRILKDYSIYTLPDKTVYTKWEAFDSTGMVLEFDFANAQTEFVTVTDDMVFGYNSDKVGSQIVSVQYNYRTFTFTIIVNEKPFNEIRTVADLYNIRNDLTANYILMNDIDLTEATAKGGAYDFNGSGWNPIGSNDIYSNEAFKGIFDGNGHKISGLRIEISSVPAGTSDYMYVGLFANISGEVRNLTLESGTISVTKPIKGYSYLGSISALNNGAIKCCANYTNLTNYANNYIYCGGIAAVNNTIITECFNAGNVSVLGNWGKEARVGGISGSSDICATITNCYNSGNIAANRTNTSANAFAGGIQGCGDAEITNCYNTGAVTMTNINWGANSAICATTNGTVTITNCYYLAGTGTSSTGATSLSATQLKQIDMMPGFDFETVWVEDEYAKYAYPQLRSNPQNLEEAVEEISLLSEPAKLYCYKGGKLDCTGAQLEVIYVSGNVSIVDITNDMLTFDNETLGTATVTVTFDDQTVTFEIEIKEYPTATKIELVSEPDNTTYIKNRTVDYTGAKIKVTFDDESTEIIDVTESMVTGIDITTSGTYTATITFNGLTTTFTAKVVAFRVTGIAISKLPTKTEYIENEEISYQGLEIVLTYNDGTTKAINRSLCTITGYTGEVGKNTITVTYSYYSATFDVNVVGKALKSIEIVSEPTKINYVVGQTFDSTGLVVKANYNNGESFEVTNYTLEGDTLDNIGYQTIYVSYRGYTTSFTVKVELKQIVSFDIVKAPLKTDYNEGEPLDLTGIVVKAVYNDGTQTQPDDFEITGYSSTPGSKTVMLTYEGIIDSFFVTVHAKQLCGIEITTPDKQSYYMGDKLDTAGFKVYALYDNGAKTELGANEYTLTGFDSTTTGIKTVVVTYSGYTKEFAVNVTNRPESSLSFTVSSTKARYGENVTVIVSAENNSGISGLCQTIEFNQNKMDFVSAKLEDNYNGTFIVTDDYKADGKVVILWSNATDNFNNTPIYSLTFTVKDNIGVSTEDIIISGAENSVCNAAGELIYPTYKSGEVEILDWWIGDLDGDRDYSMADLIMLAQYIAEKPMELTEKQQLSADVNEDNIIDIRDVTLLSQMIIGKEI